MPGMLLTAGSMVGGGVNGSGGSMDVVTVGSFPQDNGAADTRLLNLILTVTTLTGGTTPAVTMTTSRYEVDNVGNPTSVVTAIDSPAGLTAVGTQTRNIGPNQAQAATLRKMAKVAVVVTGAPTTVAWQLFATVTE